MIHLDTSFLIRALARHSLEDLKLREWLLGGISLGISSICWAEFLCGPVEPRHVELAARIVQDRVPFVAEDAELSARLYNLSGRRRGSLIDCMIAATALRVGASLATGNPADFRRLEAAGLRIVAT
jgi:predicted nucleic acid-binding protein